MKLVKLCVRRIYTLPPPLQVEAGGYFGIMARGLPYDATKNEVAEFFSECCIKNGHDGIHILIGPDGRLQGDAVIEMEGQEDLEKAKQLNNQMMGRRYIEISTVSRAVADHALSSQPRVSIDVNVQPSPFSTSFTISCPYFYC